LVITFRNPENQRLQRAGEKWELRPAKSPGCGKQQGHDRVFLWSSLARCSHINSRFNRYDTMHNFSEHETYEEYLKKPARTPYLQEEEIANLQVSGKQETATIALRKDV